MAGKFWHGAIDQKELEELQDGLSHMHRLQEMGGQLVERLKEAIQKMESGRELRNDDLQHIDLLIGEIKYHIHDTLHDLQDVERDEQDKRWG